MEGALRWTRKQEGTDVVGTDRVMLAVCWDDWDGGVGEHVTRLIDSIWGSVRVKEDLYKICNPQRKFYKKKSKVIAYNPAEKRNSKTYFSSNRYRKTSHRFIPPVRRDIHHYRCHTTTIPAIRPMSCPGVFDGGRTFFGRGCGLGLGLGCLGDFREESWYALVCPWARSWLGGLESWKSRSRFRVWSR